MSWTQHRLGFGMSVAKGTLLLALAIWLCGNSMSRAEEAPSSRAELESRIGELISSTAILMENSEPAPKDPNADWRPYIPTTVFESEGFEGPFISQTTVEFEGCIVVSKLRRSLPVRDERIDLTYLETEPSLAEIGAPSEGYEGLGTSVLLPLLPDIARELDKVRTEASDIRQRAYDMYPSDVASRLIWIREQHDQFLNDIYKNAGEVNYHEGAVEIAGPAITNGTFGEWRFYVDPGHGKEFALLVHQYRTTFCL